MYSDTQSDSPDSLVANYAPLVKRIAHHLMARMPSSVQVDDLVQAGLVGLLEAAKNYDAGKGASFETYAGIRIRGAMIDDVRKGDWAPRSVHRNTRRVTEAIHEVEAELGRDATDQEVASKLDISLDEYYAILNDSSASRLFSLEEITGPDSPGDEQLEGGALNPLEEAQQKDFRSQLSDAISQLPEREQLVLSLYYEEELNLKEIGMILEVSESRVSQIHSQATLRLRSKLVE